MGHIANQTFEGQLLNRYGQGDETAFRELVDRYKDSLYNFLRRFLNRPDQVDDVLQETLIQLYTSRDSYDVSRPLRPWLYTIAANKARDALRRAKNRPVIPISSLLAYDTMSLEETLNNFASHTDNPLTWLDRKEEADRIRRAVARLPKKHREILTLAYFDQLTYRQIAETIRIPMGTVKSRLHTAVRRFAKEWACFQEDPAASNPAVGASLTHTFRYTEEACLEAGCTQEKSLVMD